MGAAPVVIEAEAVQRDTKSLMTALWEKIGLPFNGAAFEWQNETPKDWEQVGGWHDQASNSTGIRPPSADEDARKRQEFDALVSKHPHLAEFLAHHAPFHQRLQAEALTI